jgi:hypothetical protein
MQKNKPFVCLGDPDFIVYDIPERSKLATSLQYEKRIAGARTEVGSAQHTAAERFWWPGDTVYFLHGFTLQWIRA